MVNTRAGRGGCGVTLIETVVAVALSAVVAVLCAAVALSVRRALESRWKVRGARIEDFALHLWAADVESAFAPEGGPPLRLDAQAADTGRPRLQFARWGEPEPSGTLGIAQEVIWRMAEHAEAQGVWERISRARAGPGAEMAPVTTRVVSGLAAVRIEATDGTNWWSNWPPLRGGNEWDAAGLPKGLRLTLEVPPRAPRTAVAAIRAATEVRPTIERRGGAAPAR